MKAPKKIYLQVCGDCKVNDCENCKFEDLEDNVTWCRDKIFDKDIEYTRTDTFIHKVERWINSNFKQSLHEVITPFSTMEDAIKDFKNYMKGSKV